MKHKLGVGEGIPMSLKIHFNLICKYHSNCDADLPIMHAHMIRLNLGSNL